MNAVAIATDRDSFRLDTTRAHDLLLKWGMEVRKRRRARQEFEASLVRLRPSSTAERATETVRVFHRKDRMSRTERIKLEAREDHERARRRNQRNAELRERRGRGPVRKCTLCQRIYRGDVDACKCKPCAHCGTRFTGAGFKCKRCKHIPALITARGTQTRSAGPTREAQMRLALLSNESLMADGLVAQLDSWQENRIRRRYDWQQADFEAAQELRVPIARYVGEVRAAIEAFATELAKTESSAV